MTINDLVIYHEATCQKARDLMYMKNADYSEGDDRFRNFRGSEAFGIDPMIGVCLRMQDKLNRIVTFARAGKLTSHRESVDDSVLDLVNYAVILGAMATEKTNQEG